MCRAAQDRAHLEPVSQLAPPLLRLGCGGSDADMFSLCVTVHPVSHLAEATWLGLSSLSPARSERRKPWGQEDQDGSQL